jgi:DNA gyrase subunit A
LHIVEGLLIAQNNLDDVIEGIRKSKDVREAKEFLQSRYLLTEKQAQAVLDLRLQRLTSLEREKLIREEEELTRKIAEFKAIVESEEERIKIFIKETEEVIKKFGDPRRTFIEGSEKELLEGSIVVAILENGRVVPVENMPEGESPVVDILDVPYTEGLFLVSNRGRVYWIAGSQALQGSKINFKESEEFLIGAFIRERYADRLLLATERGYIKKIPLVDFEYKAQGMPIIKFKEEGDQVVGIARSFEGADIVMFSERGKVVRFKVGEVQPATPNTRGSVGMKLEEEDRVVGVKVIRDEPFLVVITKSGKIKKISQEEIPLRSKGAKGVRVLSTVRDSLVALYPARSELDLLISTLSGKAFYDKIDISELPLSRRDQVERKRWDLGEDEIRRVVRKSLENQSQEEKARLF